MKGLVQDMHALRCQCRAKPRLTHLVAFIMS